MVWPVTSCGSQCEQVQMNSTHTQTFIPATIDKKSVCIQASLLPRPLTRTWAIQVQPVKISELVQVSVITADCTSQTENVRHVFDDNHTQTIELPKCNQLTQTLELSKCNQLTQTENISLSPVEITCVACQTTNFIDVSVFYLPLL